MRRVGRLLATMLVGVAVVGGAAAGVGHPAGVVGGRPAERGPAEQVTEPAPAPLRCARVVVIGDSLMDNAEPWLVKGLKAGGYDAFVDAQPSREIGLRRAAPYSGVLAARAARASFGEADCWVIALGSNDLLHGAGDPAVAARLVDEQLAELTPEARVWWVNVDYHRDPRYDVDFPGRAAVFNAAVDAAAAAERLTVIDWYSYAEQNLQWFFDPVHVDRDGSIARAGQTIAALG